MQEQDPVPPEQRQWARMLAQWSSIIFLLPACLGVGLFLGIWLDKKLGTAPWMTIAFFLLGSAAAFYQTFRIVSRKESSSTEKTSPRRREERESNDG